MLFLRQLGQFVLDFYYHYQLHRHHRRHRQEHLCLVLYDFRLHYQIRSFLIRLIE